MQYKNYLPKPIARARLLALILVLVCFGAMSATAQTNPPVSGVKRVVVWDGEAHDKGSSWVNPTTSTFVRTTEDAHSGKTALEFKFHDKNVWFGSGFDWFDWKAGRDIGTDTSNMTNLNFWIKVKGSVGDLIVQLLCNGDVIDTPEHHTKQMNLAKYCPDFRDGKWHEVVIPLSDMDYPKGYDPKVVTMIDFGFYSDGEAEGAFWIDDIAFDNRKIEPKPESKTAVTGEDNSNGVPKALLSQLTTGVNVTRWFCYLGPGDQNEHFATYLTDADYQNFKRLGVSFVRLCISPDLIYSGGKPTDKLSAIDDALTQLYNHHIVVIWDLHDNGQLGLDKPDQDNSGLVNFWSAIAEHYKGRHYSDLVFEVVNEPVFTQKPDDWYGIQSKVVQAIRKQDPDRTIMVSPTYWSSIDTLQKMPVLPDKNLIYTVHCYDPFPFTHQGAEWVGEYPGKFNSLPFPSSPEAVEKILAKNDSKYAGTLTEYGKQHYDAAYLLSRLKMASDWGVAHHVPILLGEFGAYPKVSPPDSRGRWFDGMRSAIASLKLPNAIWGYDDGLGLGRAVHQDGSLWLDPVPLSHLYGVQP
jgi:hypothetical protein